MPNEKVLESKKAIVKEIADKIKDAKSVVLFDYRGLTVSQLNELRSSLRETKTELKIYKNTLTKRAFEELKFDFDETLVGPNAMIISENLVEPIKVLTEFAKSNDALEIKAGIVEGEKADLELIEKLSTLPTREGLLTMLAGGLIGTVRDLAVCLDLITEEKNKEEK